MIDEIVESVRSISAAVEALPEDRSLGVAVGDDGALEGMLNLPKTGHHRFFICFCVFLG